MMQYMYRFYITELNLGPQQTLNFVLCCCRSVVTKVLLVFSFVTQYIFSLLKCIPGINANAWYNNFTRNSIMVYMCAFSSEIHTLA